MTTLTREYCPGDIITYVDTSRNLFCWYVDESKTWDDEFPFRRPLFSEDEFAIDRGNIDVTNYLIISVKKVKDDSVKFDGWFGYLLDMDTNDMCWYRLEPGAFKHVGK